MTTGRRRLGAILAAVCASLCVPCLCAQAVHHTLPDGKGKTEFVHNCTACHSADMVTRVKKTPDDWRKSVDDMAARGTDGTKEDLDNVVLYLDKYFALDAPAPADATHSTLNPSDVEHVKHIIAENSCLTCHRIEQQGADIAPSLNGVSGRHTADEIRAAIIHHPPTTSFGNSNPAPSYEEKITGEDLDILVRYLDTLPALP